MAQSNQPSNQISLKDIYDYFENNREVYDGLLIRKWLKSNKIELLSALSSLLREKKYYLKIKPPLTFLDYYNLVIDYFSLCFEKDHSDPCIDSRYSAGRDLIYWFMNFWNDKKIPRKYLKHMKDWIAEIYKNGDKELKECLITATLEHLFEDTEIREFFSDWQEDPELNEAYESAKQWWDLGKIAPKEFSVLEISGHKRK